MEYQKITREIEHLSRLYVAYQFVCAEETKVRSEEELKDMQESILKLQETITENERKIKELSKEIAELEKKKDQVFSFQQLIEMIFQVAAVRNASY